MLSWLIRLYDDGIGVKLKNSCSPFNFVFSSLPYFNILIFDLFKIWEIQYILFRDRAAVEAAVGAWAFSSLRVNYSREADKWLLF